MTIKEAERIAREFESKTKKTESDVFLFTEAMEYLIRVRQDPGDMMWLGGYYYEIQNFDLALHYYEMAEECGSDEACECLGYIWYYGCTGKVDYEKAYRYFSRMMEKGHLVSAYKVADMYKNGYYVEKDEEKFASIIESLYPKASKCRDVFDPVPEIFIRLAEVRKKQGKDKDVKDLYLAAKDFLAQRLENSSFFGDFNIMKQLINDMYETAPPDPDDLDLYDLYYVLKTPNKVRFCSDEKNYEVEAVMDGRECAVKFGDKWYRDRDQFFSEATIDGKPIALFYYDLYGFEVV